MRGEIACDGEFPSQKGSNAEKISMLWRHHEPSGTQMRLLILFGIFVKKTQSNSLVSVKINLPTLLLYQSMTETLCRMADCTVYLKKYAHGFCFAVLCCGYTLTDFPISIRLTSLALWQSNDCPSASKATLMNMDKYFMWIHNERLHNHNKAKHNKTVCIFLGIYCKWQAKQPPTGHTKINVQS